MAFRASGATAFAGRADELVGRIEYPGEQLSEREAEEVIQLIDYVQRREWQRSKPDLVIPGSYDDQGKGDRGGKTVTIDQFHRLEELRDQYSATKAFQVRFRLELLHDSQRIFEGNRADLVTGLSNFKNDTEFTMERLRIDGDFEMYVAWLNRSLHNFLASVFTLKDHTTRTAKALIPHASPARSAYDERVAADFTDSGLVQFVHGLRNYTLHFQLPASGGSITFRRDSGVSHQIDLDRDDLLEWKKWTAPARDYVGEQSESIDLLDCVCRYSTTVERFHRWLVPIVLDENKHHLDAAMPLMGEIAALEDRLGRVFVEDHAPPIA